MLCFGCLKKIWEENRTRVFVIQRVIQEALESFECVHQVRDFFNDFFLCCLTVKCHLQVTIV